MLVTGLCSAQGQNARTAASAKQGRIPGILPVHSMDPMPGGGCMTSIMTVMWRAVGLEPGCAASRQ
jgi:hypothetical protein